MAEREESVAGPPAGRVRVFAVPGATVPERIVALARGMASVAGGGRGAAVIVLPGQVPLGVDELDLVERAAAPGTAVVFVLAGPAGGAGFGDAARRQRALLGEFAPGYEQCPIVSADAPAEVLRAALADAQCAAAARDADAALAADRAAAERARRNRGSERARAAARTESSALRRHRNALAGRKAQLRTAEGLPARMAALRTGLSRARVELGHEIAALSRRTAAAVRDELDVAGRTQIGGYPAELTRRLEAMGDELAAMVEQRIAAAVPEFSDASPGAQADAGGGAIRPLLPAPPGRRRRATEDRLMILMGASGGLGVGRLVTAGPLAGGLPGGGPWAAFAWPAALVLGGFVAWWIVRARAHLGARSRVRQWANEAIAEFRAAWEQHIAHRVLDAESEAARAVAEAHARETREIDRRLADIDGRLARLHGRFPGPVDERTRGVGRGSTVTVEGTRPAGSEGPAGSTGPAGGAGDPVRAVSSEGRGARDVAGQ
ncbi:hypothetical protein [Tomitella fengzijianii]|uniref:Uncharacterized protein n=1 Tax=Tomitella fengzijianii TaxID=2597660 RepID=A0A516X766_9ACTN|nr:hypothetical protein [Tomitella fengzijianii]QDQ98511.1 hypothetical protein FO059_15770 [Tomitella fengzijianii]